MTGQPSDQAEQRAGLPEASPECQAMEMLEAFGSVGANRFDLTLIREGEEKKSFRRNCSIEQLRTWMSDILRNAAAGQKSVIVRPRGAQAFLVQLDDLDAAKVERVKFASFLVLCTSPGSYQAWVAVCDGDQDFGGRLKKGVGADPSASGATRVSGSFNFKGKHSPTFPRVETVSISPGVVVSRADLEARGVVSSPKRAALTGPPGHSSLRPGGPRRFPDYEDCLRKAPKRKRDGKPDRSKAVYFFCYLSAKWGWSAEATADQLMRISDKAQEKGRKWTLLNARNAARNAGRMAGGGGEKRSSPSQGA